MICPNPIGNPPSLWHTFLKAIGGHTLILTLWSPEALSGEIETSFTLVFPRNDGVCPKGLIPYDGAASPAAKVFALRESSKEGVAAGSSGVGC